MLRKWILIVMIAVVALTACGVAAQQTQTLEAEKDGFYGGGGGAPAPSLPEALPYAPVEDAPAREFASGTANTVAQAQATDRLVIKNASLALVVKDPSASADSIAALAQSLNGFVVSSNVYQTSVDAEGNRILGASVTIRVPVDKLDQALAQLKGLAVKVESTQITGEDVTAQYSDLESQLKNLETAEAQLQRIMTDAKRTEDVLNVFNQLTAIRGQIEQIKGQMKYYRESSDMSLISVTLTQDVLSQPIETGGWQPEGVAKDAVEALVRALQGVVTALIWAGIYVLPLVLLFGVPVLVAVWVMRRRMRKAKPVTA
jgi:hypothetical protein